MKLIKVVIKKECMILKKIFGDSTNFIEILIIEN